jgi:hypothetical protein
MNDSDLKAKLAEAEGHYSRYRWDDAIARFEAILAAHPDHAAAKQGLADALEQKAIDAELAESIVQARASLAEHEFADALTGLNRAQTRGALRHILKYHGEIDGLRTQAQEGQEWRRRADQALAQAEELAGQHDLDAALAALDSASHELSARGWESLGEGLREARDRLWAQRDLEERIHFATAAFDRQDYRLAAELAQALHRELPRRDDIRRLHERVRATWGRIQERLQSVDEALTAERLDDAVAMLARLRGEYPNNPEWQALWLRVHMDHGRGQAAAGRREMANHRFEAAAAAFGAAKAAFTASLEVFESHPTATLELAEAEALYACASLADQGSRDTAAQRWEPARRAWEAAAENLRHATQVRRRDFGEIAAVVKGMLAEASAVVADLEQARSWLIEGRQALDARDAGRARDCFRSGLGRAERSTDGLKEELSAGLREAERVQREVRKLLGQADHAADAKAQLELLRRAYDRWETAPGMPERLVDALLRTAAASLAAGDEETAAACCEQVYDIPHAAEAAQAQAAAMAAGISGRRKVQAALTEARRLLAELEKSSPAGTLPNSVASYQRVIDILSRGREHIAEAPEARASLDDLLRTAQERHARLAAAEPFLARSETARQAGDWATAAQELGRACEQLGELAGATIERELARCRETAAAVDAALAAAGDALTRAEELYGAARDGDVAAVQWAELDAALVTAGDRLAAPPDHADPLPPAWGEQLARVNDLSRRVRILQQVREKAAAGRAVEAAPLLQAQLVQTPDPVLNAVLRRLVRSSAGAASERAGARLAAAEAHLRAGELDEARAALAEARAYEEAAPEVTPAVKRFIRQAAWIEKIGQCAATGRASQAARDYPAALAAYRDALELGAGTAGACPEPAREHILSLLALEDRLWHDEARRTGDEILAALLSLESRHDALPAFFAVPLRGWWKLAQRAADLAYIESQMALGDYRLAAGRAVRRVTEQPDDPLGRELYARCLDELLGRMQRGVRRRLDRANRLAGEGAYTDALAEIDRIETFLLAPQRAALPDIEQREALEPALEEAADLRLRLAPLHAIAARLEPLAGQMQEATLAGRFDEALAALAQAEVIDPHRRIAAVWADLDSLAGLVVARRQSRARDELETVLEAVEAALDLSGPADEAANAISEALAALVAARPALRALDGADAETLAERYARAQAKALSLRASRPAPLPVAAPASPAPQPVMPDAGQRNTAKERGPDRTPARVPRDDEGKPARPAPADEAPAAAAPPRPAEAARLPEPRPPTEKPGAAPSRGSHDDTPGAAQPNDAGALASMGQHTQPERAAPALLAERPADAPRASSPPTPLTERQNGGRSERGNGKARPDPEPVEPIPFDITDWLSNVTEVAPEDDAQP